jgi:hypothetical protein
MALGSPHPGRGGLHPPGMRTPVALPAMVGLTGGACMEMADVRDVAACDAGALGGALSTIDLVRKGASVPVPLSEVTVAGPARCPA